MGFWGNFLLLLRFAAESYVANYIFAFTLLRRDRFGQRLAVSLVWILCALLLMAALCAFGPLEMAQSQMLAFGFILGPLNFAWLLFCFQDSAWNLVFCAVFGLMTKLGTIQLLQALRCAAPAGSTALFSEHSAVGILSQYAVIALVYGSVYLVIGRHYERSDSLIRCGKRIIPLYLFVAVAMPVISSVLSELPEEDRLYAVLLNACAAIICFLVIQVQFSLSREMASAGHSATMDALLAESQKQFDSLKESIEIVNLKCHDMRHQLRTLEAGSGGTYLEELAAAIDIYDSSIHTGNSVLDVILTDKSLRCAANGIQFTCIAEGEKLAFMSESDINSLFGNAIENAMEYLEGVEDAERRYLSLAVKANAGVLFIRMENYWCGEPLRWSGGLPVTTKEGDVAHHGFGMRSMQRVAEKYGGELQVRVEDDLFQVIAAIPIQ